MTQSIEYLLFHESTMYEDCISKCIGKFNSLEEAMKIGYPIYTKLEDSLVIAEIGENGLIRRAKCELIDPWEHKFSEWELL